MKKIKVKNRRVVEKDLKIQMTLRSKRVAQEAKSARKRGVAAEVGVNLAAQVHLATRVGLLTVGRGLTAQIRILEGVRAPALTLRTLLEAGLVHLHIERVDDEGGRLVEDIDEDQTRIPTRTREDTFRVGVSKEVKRNEESEIRIEE